MKKKIKDLTIKECDKICNKQPYCSVCPLNYGSHCRYEKLKIDKEEKTFNLEREVEIDESNND